MRYKVIVNPVSGRGYGERSIPQIETLLTSHGLDFDLVRTCWAGEAIEIARQAVLDGYDTIVAAGGDGTYQEVINGMLLTAPEAAYDGQVVGNLGILPVGSGCDLSWMLGVPPDLEGACARLARHETKLMDVARITVDGETRYFDNTVGIGFEGVVTVEARKVKYLRGMALYLPVVIKSIFHSLKPVRATIEYEHEGGIERLAGSFLMVDVCNGGRAGGAFLVAPDAENDDGLLDICIAPEISRMRMLALIPHFLRGTHVNQPEVTTFRTRRISIIAEDGLFAHADGELLCTDARRIDCEVLPRKVRAVY